MFRKYSTDSIVTPLLTITVQSLNHLSVSSSVSSAPSCHGLRKSCTGTMFNVFSSTVFKQCESCQLPQALSRRLVLVPSSIMLQLLAHRSLGRRGSSHVSAPPASVTTGPIALHHLVHPLAAVEGAPHQFSSSYCSCADVSISFHARSHIGCQSLSPTIT